MQRIRIIIIASVLCYSYIYSSDGPFFLQLSFGHSGSIKQQSSKIIFNEKSEVTEYPLEFKLNVTSNLWIGVEYATQHRTFVEISLEYPIGDPTYNFINLIESVGLGHSMVFPINGKFVSLDLIINTANRINPIFFSISYKTFEQVVDELRFECSIGSSIKLDQYFSIGLDFHYLINSFKQEFVGYNSTYGNSQMNKFKVGTNFNWKIF